METQDYARRVTIFGICIDNITKSEVPSMIADIIGVRGEKPNLIGSVQIHKLNIAYRDKDVTQYLNECKLCYCDGNGVRWGAKLLGHPLKERMTAPDFILDVFRECVNKRYRVYVLGGGPGVLEKAFEKVGKLAPGLNIVGLHHGYFDLKRDNEGVVADINKAKPDLLIVGMGIPKQEKWALENMTRLKVGTIWALGATFDYFAGVQSRGPVFLRKSGHEWLGRLLSDPGNLAKRYLIGNPLFFSRILREKFSFFSHR
jgi:N-acetylglucosaminyldiphosphoundecaprenol N-acetyl-beta-D-mannosaminyltransferase